jgi:hypothetical protein
MARQRCMLLDVICKFQVRNVDVCLEETYRPSKSEASLDKVLYAENSAH